MKPPPVPNVGMRQSKMGLSAYGGMGLGEALARGSTPDYAEACLELAECVLRVFARSAKSVQGAMLADCATAACMLMSGSEVPDEARVRAASRLSEAIGSARTFPAAKRKALAAAFRKVLVEARRRCSRFTRAGIQAEGDLGAGDGVSQGQGEGADAREAVDVALGHLPEDVRVRIFSHLDPVSLGRCACVSRGFARETALDVLWQPLFDHLTADAALGSDRIRELCSGEGSGAGQTEQRHDPTSSPWSGRSPRSLNSVLDLVDMESGGSGIVQKNWARGTLKPGTAKAWFLRERAAGEGGMAAIKAHGRLVCSLCEQLFWIPPASPAEATHLIAQGNRSKRLRRHEVGPGTESGAMKPKREAVGPGGRGRAKGSIAETLKTLLGCGHGCQHVLVRPTSPLEAVQLAIMFDVDDSPDSDSDSDSSASSDDDDDDALTSARRTTRVLIGSHRLE